MNIKGECGISSLQTESGENSIQFQIWQQHRTKGRRAERKKLLHFWGQFLILCFCKGTKQQLCMSVTRVFSVPIKYEVMNWVNRHVCSLYLHFCCRAVGDHLYCNLETRVRRSTSQQPTGFHGASQSLFVTVNFLLGSNLISLAVPETLTSLCPTAAWQMHVTHGIHVTRVITSYIISATFGRQKCGNKSALRLFPQRFEGGFQSKSSQRSACFCSVSTEDRGHRVTDVLQTPQFNRNRSICISWILKCFCALFDVAHEYRPCY